MVVALAQGEPMEIVEHVGNRHDKVMQSIERLAVREVIALPPLGDRRQDLHVSHRDRGCQPFHQRHQGAGRRLGRQHRGPLRRHVSITSHLRTIPEAN